MENAFWREPTRGQWISFAAAWFGWILDAFDFTIFLLVMPQITKEFGVSTTAAASTITLTLLMRLIGGLGAGWLADRWGRKLPLMISVIWFALCDGAIAFAPTFGWVLVLRTLFGFGMGAEWTSGATLAMENWPARSRGIASGVLQGSWAIGYLLAGIVAAAVVPRWGWRALFLLAALPALLVLPIRVWVPESLEPRSASAAERPSTLAEMKRPGMLTKLAWASLIMALGLGAYYGLTSQYSTLLQKELGQSLKEVATYVSLFNIGMMLGAITCGIVAVRRGVVLAIITPALLVLPVLPLYVGASPDLLALGALLGGAFGAGCSGVTPLLLTSLFPPHVRARSLGLVYHVGAFVAASVPTAVAALAERSGFSFSRAIVYVAGACNLGLAAAMLLRPRAAAEAERSGAASTTASSMHP